VIGALSPRRRDADPEALRGCFQRQRAPEVREMLAPVTLRARLEKIALALAHDQPTD
jgi:hypothetical protein